MRLIDENTSFRINQSGLRKFLGDLECDIMEVVWKKAKPTVTVREVYEIMRKERQLAYTTIMTTMSRLAEKGILQVVNRARLAHCYAPAETRDEFLKNSVSHVLKVCMREFPNHSHHYLEDLSKRKNGRATVIAKKKR